MSRLPEEVNDLTPASANMLMYTLSNSRQDYDLKYQMPKHNMHVNLLFYTKVFLFLRKQLLWAKDLQGIFELD